MNNIEAWDMYDRMENSPEHVKVFEKGSLAKCKLELLKAIVYGRA